MKKYFLLFAVLVCVLSSLPAFARTEGFYIGGGYQQPLMFTWKSQSAFMPSPGDKLNFWPGFGAYLIGGYEFERPDWLGLALTPNWGYIKLNKAEWVNIINADANMVMHLANPENKLDPFISLLAGFTYMMEGKIKNESASVGPDFGASFGFRYTISEYARAGASHVKNLSFMAEVPVKVILFVNDYDLSNSNMTPIISIPVRVGMTYTF
jgi:hypothetical protein